MRQYEANDSKLYRSRNGMILGVCKGISECYALPVFWFRVACVALAITTTVWPVIITYFIAGFLLKPRPVIDFTNENEHEFYDSYVTSRSMALHRLKRKFNDLNSRIQRIEDVVTSKDFTWKQKYNH